MNVARTEPGIIASTVYDATRKYGKGGEKIATGFGKLRQAASGIRDVASGVRNVTFSTAAIPLQATRAAVSVTYIPGVTTLMGKLKEQSDILDKIPSFYKVMFLIFFYIFFYRIVYDIGIFFGLKNIELILYMIWFGILLLFLSFISGNRSKFNN
jgi:hypothetical protein